MSIIKRERWTEDEVLSLPTGEHDYFERKSGSLLSDPDFRAKMAKALSALANSGGGHLVLGARDDGSLDGVSVVHKGRSSTRDWLEQVIPEMLSYPLQDFRVHEVEPASPSLIPLGSVVIVIDVGDSMLAPHQSTETKLYYYRVGGRSLPAPHFYLETLRGREKYPGPTIARAWFDTVINPLLRALQGEQSFLARKRWTWNEYPTNLSELHYLIERPYHSVSDNQEQFFNSYPNIRDTMQGHDQEVTNFRMCIEQLHNVVKSSDELKSVYEIAISTDSLRTIRDTDLRYSSGNFETDEATLSRLFNVNSEQERLNVLARYIVNNFDDLPDTRTPAPLWNTYKDAFLGILNQPLFYEHRNRMESVRDMLARHVEVLITSLKATREELAKQYRVPYEPVSSQ